MLITAVRQDDPRLLERADPAYWHPAYERLFATCPWPRQPLGDFIAHLTYGPIITGAKPPRAAEGVALVNQGQIAFAGVDLREAVTVPPGCDWDLARARLQRGDLVMARSGVASVARNRLALYWEDRPAVVGSFVDLVRLEGLDPVYVALYLKTGYGWGQIHRLINGVATPNISFEEIRGLQLAVLPTELQKHLSGFYFRHVYPLHTAGEASAEAAHRHLVDLTQQLLRGEGSESISW